MITLLLGIGCILSVILVMWILQESSAMRAWEVRKEQLQVEQIERLRKETQELQSKLGVGVYQSPIFVLEYPKSLKEDVAIRKEQNEEGE